ncbi:MAG: peptidyl-prolyl cis-trans isomerase [Aureliella sp.]
MSYLRALSCLAIWVIASQPCRAMEGEASENGRSEADMIVAYVGVEPITLADIDFHLGRPANTYRDQPLSEAVKNRAIDLIVKQRRALETLRKASLAATREEVYQWVSEQSREPNAERSAVAIIRERAKRAAVADSTVIEQIAFRLSWQKYLAKHLNESNLAKYFSAKPARFDGTSFELEIVTLPVRIGGSAERDTASQQLREFRNQVVGKDVATYVEGAKANGWRCARFEDVRVLGDIEPALVDAVIDMDVGDVSEPTNTIDGVHLIRVNDRKAGERQLDEVRSEVRLHMILYLLDRLAAQSKNRLPLRPELSS